MHGINPGAGRSVTWSATMKPPPDRRLDLHGAGTDLPLRTQPRYGVRWSLVFLIATLLGVGSSALAYQLTISLGKPADHWWTLVIVNCTYWYLWAIFAPAIVWLSQHFRLERQGLVRALAVHLPSVLMFSLGHIAAMAARHCRGKTVLVVDGGAALCPSEHRLGDDDVLGHRRFEPRRLVLQGVA
jgi:hypothetical protein